MDYYTLEISSMFESVDQILMCHHSIKSYRAVLSFGVILLFEHLLSSLCRYVLSCGTLFVILVYVLLSLYSHDQCE